MSSGVEGDMFIDTALLHPFLKQLIEIPVAGQTEY